MTREEVLSQYESAAHAFREATERSKDLTGVELYEAMIEIDRLHEETIRLEHALAQAD